MYSDEFLTFVFASALPRPSLLLSQSRYAGTCSMLLFPASLFSRSVVLFPPPSPSPSCVQKFVCVSLRRSLRVLRDVYCATFLESGCWSQRENRGHMSCRCARWRELLWERRRGAYDEYGYVSVLGLGTKRAGAQKFGSSMKMKTRSSLSFQDRSG